MRLRGVNALNEMRTWPAWGSTGLLALLVI
jgi:hypothetical protein